MKITFYFKQMPGDAQIEAMTTRVEGADIPLALGKAQLFVQSITTVAVERIVIELDAPKE